MQEHERPTAEALLALKGELRSRWEQLPPEHQASMVLTLIGDVMDGEWGAWLRDAFALRYPAVSEQNIPPRETHGSLLKDEGGAFGFTRTERLYDFIGHGRFLALLKDEQTTIHEAQVSTNNYGEFLFVTASRHEGDRQEVVSFWGLGFHDRRDRYVLDEWRWYTSELGKAEHNLLEKDEVLTLIDERRSELRQQAQRYQQSASGMFFEHLAELTDEDAAATEMDDLGEMLDDLLGE